MTPIRSTPTDEPRFPAEKFHPLPQTAPKIRRSPELDRLDAAMGRVKHGFFPVAEPKPEPAPLPRGPYR